MSAQPVSPFAPARFLAGAHVQTVWGRMTRPRRLVPWRRETLETPDGDTLLLDHAEPEGAPPDAPRALLLHGLEGSSYSVYVQGLAKELRARGFAVTALNFRSCARDPEDVNRCLPNRRPRLYHSGETEDVDLVIRTLAPRTRVLVAVGVSLGGNALLKWLGEDESHRALAAAATISVPYDLAAGARHLERGLGRLYVAHFASTLQKKAEGLASRFPEARERIDLARLARARTFYDIDDAATAPLHGFAGAEDYWARSSSLAFLSRISTPTLALSSLDDPFLPPAVLSRVRDEASPSVTLVATGQGGHVGFVSGSAFAPAYWAERTVAEFLHSTVRLADC
ncbi:MAG TPA: alpha/beta fold hydrolase [Thermoanaerobaculia bacterium]|nr:alpha/beta fold hydrolase [Thermoanaerobaculia bacterium]